MDYFALLRPFGWNESFESEARSLGMGPSLLPARITSEERSVYKILSVRPELERAEISGSLRHSLESQGNRPIVGDWVLGEIMPGTNRLRIESILERRTLLKRRMPGLETKSQLLAANVDTALIVMALQEDFSLARLERYMALCRDGGIEPWVVLSKCDLSPELGENLVGETRRIARTSPIFLVSSRSGEGIRELALNLLAAQTTIAIGSSGVGKSSLLNALAGEELEATSATTNDGRGRHTTTGRSLHRLPSGALYLDSPGLREVGLWIDGDGLSEAFSDIQQLAPACRFRDCRHEHEPGCAVLEAIASGELDERRLRSLKKLEREENFLARKADKALASAEKKRWKAISKAQRKFYR